ncbi:MAG: SH3 domain-containing protein [Pelagibacteraceae bacterium]|nr:SH3 domain-containing protein [Pelagibacteraceae bacterium]MBO6492271.1 SH3 domain-containing protein [Pelagibacteraceae bacterium]
MKILILISFFNILLINDTPSSEKDYFLTLKYNRVKVRQGPSFEYPVKFIYKKKYLPIKIIDNKDNFRKITDLKNNNGWIHVSQLSKKKSAINIHNLSIIFKKPNIYSQPMAKLEKGKIVIVKKCKEDWCKIITNDYKGWIFKNYLWGNF